MRLLILGAGPLGLLVAEAAQAAGSYEEIIFLDDQGRKGPDIMGGCGGFPVFFDGMTDMLPAQETSEDQCFWLEQVNDMGFPLATVVHPDAQVAEDAQLADGTAVLAGAVVEAGAVLPQGCILCEGTRLTAADRPHVATLFRG